MNPRIGKSSRSSVEFHFTLYVLPFTQYTILCLCVWLGIAEATYSQVAETKPLADYPNQLTRDGELVVLPDCGTVYIATDFHAHWRDFNQWLNRTQLIEQIESGADVYGLILGDVVDHKPSDPIFEPYGDAKIVDRIMGLQKQLGQSGKRLIYLKGNHELAAADTYAMLKKKGMNAANRRHMIDTLYRSSQGAYFQQFNFVERMTEEQYNYLINLPTVAVGKNGLVGVHAGTSRSARSLADLARPGTQVLEELLWARPAAVQSGGYTPPQTDAFLKRIGGHLLIVGHTPLGSFPKKKVKGGVVRLGKRQVVFSTGYGAAPGVQSYLVIDLSKRYESVSELRYGVEIQLLYP